MRCGNTHHGAYRGWRVRKRRPSSHSAPVVADDHPGRESEALDHSADIESCGLRVVPTRCLVACSVAAEVHGSRAKASLIERRNLMPPCPPELTKPVEQY